MASLWRRLPAPHKRWIVLNALLVTAAVNLLVNALVAWLSVRNQTQVLLWERPFTETSTIGDTLGTLFMLPLITCLLATTAVWRELREGDLMPLERVPPYDRWLARMPSSRLVRGLLFGALGFALWAIPVTAGLLAVDLEPLTRGEFIAFKTGFAIAFGAIVTPQIALCAMTDRPLSPGPA